MTSKWLSRKWLLGMAGLILGMLVLLGYLTPVQESDWIVAVEKVVGAALAVAALLGYIAGEARVDAARISADAEIRLVNGPPTPERSPESIATDDAV